MTYKIYKGNTQQIILNICFFFSCVLYLWRLEKYLHLVGELVISHVHVTTTAM